MRTNALLGLAAAAAVGLTAMSAHAGALRRPADAASPGAPVAGQAGPHNGWHAQPGVTFAANNGMEGPSYAYGYALNVPADGRWRWIEARCYGARAGTVCVDGHWVRRQAGQCEEVSGHSVRSGGYIRIVPAGPVNTCR